ncbi:MAG TPA: hypothetical protein VMT34_01180 [Aggregatilineales bacterium]|nr:hypothetical protein [Aggregatilineales bacterium]
MIEIAATESAELNFRQRWATYLTLMTALLGLLLGVLLRARVINATDFYQNSQNGISARYPASWLLTQADLGEDLVFRVEDLSAVPFKTTMQLALRASGPDERANDVRDRLNISRSSQFVAYRALDTSPVTLVDGSPALRMNYAYVADEPNPFLQSVPVVVRGVDIIVLRNRQVLIISYRADSASFDTYYHYFDAFLRSLQF